MAKQTLTKLVDDLDGNNADRTVVFGWDGNTYEIDLSSKNVSAMEKALKPYLSAARSVSSSGPHGRRRGARAASAPRKRNDLASVRAWARANGHEVSDRGRISRQVVEAFESAQ